MKQNISDDDRTGFEQANLEGNLTSDADAEDYKCEAKSSPPRVVPPHADTDHEEIVSLELVA